MNSIFKIFFAISFVLLLHLSAFAQFEGLMVFETINAETSESATINWYVKNGNHKIDFVTTVKSEGNMNYSLLFKKTGQIVLLSESGGQKTVTRIPPEAFKSVHRIPVHAELKKLDTKKYSGITCTRYSVTTQEGLTEFCITDETGLNVQDLPAVFRNQGPMVMIERNQIKGMPVDVMMYNNSGELIYSYKLMRTAPQKLQDSLFEVPAGYKPLQQN